VHLRCILEVMRPISAGNRPEVVRKPGPLVGTHNIDTPSKMQAFVEALVEELTIGAACRRTGLQRKSILRWRASDPDFDQACRDAQEEALDVLESAL
jgi:hypothetical protein